MSDNFDSVLARIYFSDEELEFIAVESNSPNMNYDATTRALASDLMAYRKAAKGNTP